MQSDREESLRTRTDVISSLRKRLEELNTAEEEMVNSCRFDILLDYVSCTVFHNTPDVEDILIVADFLSNLCTVDR